MSRLSASLALLLLGSLVATPLASASDVLPDAIAPPCPTLPLWDASLCWVGVAFDVYAYAYQTVTCDVIGGPACGFSVDLCKLADICTETDE